MIPAEYQELEIPLYPSLQDLIRERGHNCEVCGGNYLLQRHHCLFHVLESKPELNTKENLELICGHCHPYANSYEHRCWFWQRQCERYGVEQMREWHRQLPLKVKERFE